MKTTFSDDEQVSTVTVQGEITADEVDSFCDELTKRIEEQQIRDFVLEMSEVEFIDSAGLEMLLWLQDRCAEQLGQVRIAAPAENVATILRMTRLSSQIEHRDSVSEAVESLK